MEKNDLGQKIDVLDLVIEVLKDHESNLDDLIQQLEVLIAKLSRLEKSLRGNKHGVQI